MTNEPPVDPRGYLPPPPTAPPAHATDPAAFGPHVPPVSYGGTWGVIGPGEEIVEGRAARLWSRWVPRSLANRLVTGVVALVVVLVLATGVGTYLALKAFLYNRLDQQLAATANRSEVTRLLGSPGPLGGIPVPQKVWVVVVDQQGNATTVQPSGPIFEALSVSDEIRSSLVKGTAKPKSIYTTSGSHIRVTCVTGLVQTTTDVTTGIALRQPVTVVVGLSQAEVDRTLDRLIKLELLIGISAIVLALGATSYGVRYSLRRLHGVTQTAQEVAAELSPTGTGLERRVEVHEPDTEVGQLATSMNTLLSAVETQFAERVASENRMRQFLADASHELRTPLTSIRGYAELSRMRGTGGDQDSLARIEAEGTRMSRLVDDLLTLARTDQGGERQHELLDVGDLLGEAVDGVRAAYPERRIDVTAENGLEVVGDRDQLVRVVRNLATNAAVHTRPDGPIRVSASHEAAYVVIRVSDAGPGLPPEEAAHVFERFWRADKARSRAQGGSGLGMSIVAALVADHGGYVHFDSTVAGGSTVSVRLPRA